MKTLARIIRIIRITRSARSPLAALLFLACLDSHLSTRALAQGGSLTPPPGVPGATMKSLSQIEPRTDLANVPGDATNHHIISAPGSYFLSGNLDVTKTNGISIQASDVTLDLQGFKVSRTAGTGGIGIRIPGTSHRAVIQDGAVAGFAKGVGGDLGGTPLGNSAKMLKMVATACTEIGLQAGSGWLIEHCTAASNEGGGAVTGIRTSSSCVLRACSATSNKSTGSGCFGISVDSGSIVTDCTTGFNEGATLCVGISAPACSVSRCVVGNNSTPTTGDCIGIYASANSVLSDCTAFSNFAQAGACYGISLGGNCAATNCTSDGNVGVGAADPSLNGVGIAAGVQCAITACSVTNNKADGIRITNNGVVRDCSSSGNGTGGTGAGIHVLLSGNRIDGNNVADNVTGIKVDGTRSFIIRNSSYSNNTSYVIAAINKVGVIVIAPDSGAINGSSGGAGVGSTDPWANFTY